MSPVIDRTFVISLRDRPNRLDNFLATFPKVEWLPPPEVWVAVDGGYCPPPDNWTAGGGAWGCYRSHMGILEYCLNNHVNSYLVFEDDAQFNPSFLETEEFLNALPEDWQQVYLGGQLMHATRQPPIVINDKILRPYNVNRTHCFAVHRAGMEAIYRHCSRLPFENGYHIDHHLGLWHEDSRNKVYCPYTWKVGQHGFKSDISGKEEGASFFRHPNLYLKSNYKRCDVCIVYRASPGLIPDARKVLHFGYSTGPGGMDAELAKASKLKDPSKPINFWFSWVSHEALETGRVPAIYQPELTLEEIQAALPGIKLITIASASSAENIKEQVDELVREARAPGMGSTQQ